MHVPDALGVERAVLMVLTCHSMKLFDFGWNGDKVMWSMCCDDRNLAGVSDENGGPLAVENHFSGLYWDIRCCNFCMMESAVLDDVF